MANNAEIKINVASIKVMRSYDYCHFEVCLSSTFQDSLFKGDEGEENRIAAVDELRKTAARLADKAVEQYKVAKSNAELLLTDVSRLEMVQYRHQFIISKSESEWTPEEKAIMKAIGDRQHRNRPRYNYQDDFSEPDYEDDSQDALF